METRPFRVLIAAQLAKGDEKVTVEHEEEGEETMPNIFPVFTTRLAVRTSFMHPHNLGLSWFR